MVSEMPLARQFMARVQGTKQDMLDDQTAGLHWRGVPLKKDPFDFTLLPMLLWELRPATIIELGAYKGGSALWMADTLDAFGIDARIHSFDVDVARIMARHPRVTFTRADVFDLSTFDLAALHLQYLDTWVRWSHQQGFVVRNQSHGAPANLLDLYGRVDVPETELFGSTPFPIPGLRRFDDEVRHDQDLPESLVIRMASSAAHVMGRRLASSESSTSHPPPK